MPQDLNLDPNDMSFIDSVASEQMGVPPQQPAPEAAPAKPKDEPTVQEQATAAVTPATEQSNSKKDPFEYFDVDGQAYTPEQLRGMASRYKNLNYEHQTKVAPLKKSVEFLNTLRQQAAAGGQEINDDQMASIMQAAMEAYAKNPTMGKNKDGTSGDPARQDIDMRTEHNGNTTDDINAQLAEWEANNAITLPPAYRDAIAKSTTMASQIQQLTDMVRGLTEANAATAATAENTLKTAKDTHAEAGRQQIINNMARIQNEFQFPDEAEKDFMAFVQERGYDLWELMDYDLSKKLATDFKNVQAAPELERLRASAAKRQAFTGNLSPSPASNGSDPAAKGDPDMEFINQVADGHMKSRNMMS